VLNDIERPILPTYNAWLVLVHTLQRRLKEWQRWPYTLRRRGQTNMLMSVSYGGQSVYCLPIKSMRAEGKRRGKRSVLVSGCVHLFVYRLSKWIR